MALILPKTTRLKDGRSLLIRVANESDAAGLLESTNASVRDGAGIIAEPDEFNKTEEEERIRIGKMNDHPKQLLLLADVDGVVVGHIAFHIANLRRRSHWGSFGMDVRPGWRGIGIGDALLEALLSWAAAVPGIEKVTLAVRADNPAAIALYKKHGFVESGCAKDYLKLGDGRYVDDLTMEKFVRSED